MVTSVLSPLAAPAIDSHSWPKILLRYRDPTLWRSIAEIALTLAPLAVLWVAMILVARISLWLVLPLAIPAGCFVARIFMIQHDCSHGAFFRARLANAWVGRVAGVLTMTPYDYWRRTHAIHHATTGNLDQRGIGDVDTLTVQEYLARSWWGRLGYRLYRHPAVLFGVGPAYLFILQHRLPIGYLRSREWGPWVSTMATNLGIAALAGGMIWLIGLRDFLMIQISVMLIAAAIGVWLFYVQHQFEQTRWENTENWDHPDAALFGSSHYALPRPLGWLTANIGIHHVHHLCSRIPFYRLPEVLRNHPELAAVGKLTLWKSFACVRLTLWDEAKRKLISFETLRRERKWQR